MGRSVILSAVLLLTSGAVFAQDMPQHAVRTAAPLDPTAEFFIRGEDVETWHLAEWDTDDPIMGPRIRIVWGEDAVAAAPAEASKYTEKQYVFPTGTIRVLEFKKDRGGMLHAITVETALYMLKGEGTVEVAGETVHIGEGDVVSYPSGALRGDGDATVILWHVTGTKINETAKAMVVRKADVQMSHSAQWPGPDGKMVRARAEEDLANAPADAVRLDLWRYVFDGNSVRVTKNYKGGPTARNTTTMDALIYVTSGKLRFFEEDADVIAGPGDAIREITGHYHNWIRLEDSSFIATSSMPVVPYVAEAN